MGLIDFVKKAGSKLFGAEEAEASPAPAPDPGTVNRRRAAALAGAVSKLGLDVADLAIKVDGEVATVQGTAGTQAEREKVVLVVGNTEGIAKVDDKMTVKEAKPEATYYTVVSGDTLSKIAKQHYGNAMKYPVIFEANKPMLKDPDKIYPGQVLRIPPLEG